MALTIYNHLDVLVVYISLCTLLVFYSNMLKHISNCLLIELYINSKKRIIYRFTIFLGVLLLLISIFIWRYIRRNHTFQIPWNTIINLMEQILVPLDFMVDEKFQLMPIPIILLIILLLLIILINIRIFSLFVIYIKSIFYSVHIYLLQYEKYKNIFKIYQAIVCYITLNIWGKLLQYITQKTLFHKSIFYFIYYIFIYVHTILNITIIIIPMYALYLDYKNGWLLSNTYKCLPWVYILILYKMFYNLQDNVYGSTVSNPAPDVVKKEFMYQLTLQKPVYLYCKTYKIVNKDPRKKYKKRYKKKKNGNI